jgi:hypothetical protein
MYSVWALFWRLGPPGRNEPTVLTLTRALALGLLGEGNGVVAIRVIDA